MKKALIALCSLLLVSTLAMAKKPAQLLIETTLGNIRVQLYDNTPKHSGNMVKLANEHFFDGTLFHRVIKDFMIQGGDPESKTAKAGQMLGNGEHGDRIPAEINDVDYHKRGALAMARDNNPEKASSGCQFYIVQGKKYTDAELDNIARRNGRTYTAEQREVYKTQGGTPFLDGNYTVFGEVVEGMDIVDKIAGAARDSNDRPNTDVRMIKVRVIKKKKFLIF